MTFNRSTDDKFKNLQKINYVHYDPQMHWCKQCNIFPKTAKDFLIHLHSKEHQEMQKIVEPPWHEKPLNDVSRLKVNFTYFSLSSTSTIIGNAKLSRCSHQAYTNTWIAVFRSNNWVVLHALFPVDG